MTTDATRPATPDQPADLPQDSELAARCECCGQVLPAQTGRARPRKYCPDGRGRFEADHRLTCAELGPALEKTRRVFGTEAVPAADLDRLGAQLTAVRELFGPSGPLAALAGAVAAVSERLDDTVAEARDRAAHAEATQRDAEGRAEAASLERDRAVAQALAAHSDQLAAERARDQAVRAQTAAEQAQRLAEQTAARAEEARALHEGRAERAEAAAQRDRERAEHAEAQVTRLNATIDGLRDQLRQATERAQAERDWAAAAYADTAATLTRLSAEHAQALRQAERDHAAELADRDRRGATIQAAFDQHRRQTHAALTRLLDTTTPPSAPTPDGDPDPHRAPAPASGVTPVPIGANQSLDATAAALPTAVAPLDGPLASEASPPRPDSGQLAEQVEVLRAGLHELLAVLTRDSSS